MDNTIEAPFSEVLNKVSISLSLSLAVLESGISSNTLFTPDLNQLISWNYYITIQYKINLGSTCMSVTFTA